MGLPSSLISDSAALSEVNISTNKCFGSKLKSEGSIVKIHDIDKDQIGWTALCEALEGNTTVQTLVLSDIGIGLVGLTTFSKTIAAMAALSEVRLDGNLITGSKYKYGLKSRGVEEYDCDPSGFVALLEAMKSSAISKLSIADCGIGPKGLMTAAPAMFDIAGLKEVNLSTNFGICETVSVRDGAATGIQIASGVCATVDGRWGQVQRGQADNEVKLMWLDGGTLSGWTKATELQLAVAVADVIISSATIDALRKSHPNVTFVFTT